MHSASGCIYFHGAWINSAVVAGLASNDGSAMKAMRELCVKNLDIWTLFSRHRRSLVCHLKALIFDKSDQILGLLSSEDGEGTELREISDSGSRSSKVACAPFGVEGSNLTALFEGNIDSFRASNRAINSMAARLANANIPEDLKAPYIKGAKNFIIRFPKTSEALGSNDEALATADTQVANLLRTKRKGALANSPASSLALPAAGLRR